MMMRDMFRCAAVVGLVAACATPTARAYQAASAPRAAASQAPVLSDYFPPPEDEGGWRSLLPAEGSPSPGEQAEIKAKTGVDYDKLAEAWKHNAAAGGKTGLIVIKNGYIVGEWYQDCTAKSDFNIYSSSKAYTSTAFGLILADFGNGALPSGRTLTLDTRVCNANWIPESLPLPDPRKEDITVRHLLNMASGLGVEAVPLRRPFEYALGHVDGSPFAQLKTNPGTAFHYSNAGVAHLALLFKNAEGVDLYPFVKQRLLDPIGEEQVRWTQIGGEGGIGPYTQGYSGLLTTPREHARFCYLALHRGLWGNRRVVPASYYDFAWKGTKNKPDYGAQWWVEPRHKGAPADLVQTAGARNNHGFVVPSLDLVFVRLGDVNKFPNNWEHELVMKVIDAVGPRPVE